MCAVGLQGAYYSGYLINQLDIAPNFAGKFFALKLWEKPFLIMFLEIEMKQNLM